MLPRARRWTDVWSRGRRVRTRTPRPLDEILVKGAGYTNTGHLRRRLIDAGLTQARCEICGISEWNGRPISLHLDHENGDHTDNRLENLRILCPNCHAQTETWCVRKDEPA